MNEEQVRQLAKNILSEQMSEEIKNHMELEDLKKQLEQIANDIEDRLEDLINCYEKGIVDDVIEAQQKDLEQINKILEFIGEL